MLQIYQLDNDRIWLGDGARSAHSKGHLQVLVAPPEVPEGHAARWVTDKDPVIDTPTFGDADTGSWEIIEDHRKDTLYTADGEYKLGDDYEGQTYDGLGPIPAWLSVDEPPKPEPTLEEVRKATLDAATDQRWTVMTGGLTLPGGIAVGTSIDDQNRITSVVANAQLAGLTDADEVDFKAASGWVRITIGEIKSIAGAIGQFVQACYSAERLHHEAIDALETRAELDAYDVTAGWPSADMAHQ